MTIFVKPPYALELEEEERVKAEERKQQRQKKMPSKKKQSRTASSAAPRPSTATDYDSANNTDNQQQLPTKPPPNRSPGELNILVLRRHYPDVESIVGVAPFATIYTFSPENQQWDKCDTAGTIFVCQLVSPPGTYSPRYRLIILNRKNPKNFHLDLTTAEDIELANDFLMIPEIDEETGEPHLWGIWIWTGKGEATDWRAQMSKLVVDCAKLAEHAVLVEGVRDEEHHEEEVYTQTEYEAQDDYGTDGITTYERPHNGPVAGQSIDISTLFGKPQQQYVPQEQQSTPVDLATLFGKPQQELASQQGRSATVQQQQQQQFPTEPQRFTPTADTAFFRSSSGPFVPPQQRASHDKRPASQQDVLMNLFKNAKHG